MARDIIAAVVALLKASPDITDLTTDDYIFGGEFPPCSAKNMPRKAIVVRRGAGVVGFGGRLELEKGALDIFCFGESQQKADEVRRALHVVLKYAGREVFLETLLHSFDLLMGPLSLRDPDTRWPYELTSWRFVASEAKAE